MQQKILENKSNSLAMAIPLLNRQRKLSRQIRKKQRQRNLPAPRNNEETLKYRIETRGTEEAFDLKTSSDGSDLFWMIGLDGTRYLLLIRTKMFREFVYVGQSINRKTMVIYRICDGRVPNTARQLSVFAV